MDYRKTLLATLVGFACSVTFSTVMADNISSELTDSPIGYWKTIDDVSGKPRSIVQIWKTDHDVLMGKVIKIFPKDGSNDQTKLCAACRGDRHNQPIVGMVILSGLKANQHQWGSGEILDPTNGKSYHCALHTLEHGKKLNVRGYFGVPLLGRSQTWERVDLMSG